MNKNADYAIALKVTKVTNDEKFDESRSKFFGKPTATEDVFANVPAETIFFAQINLKEIKDLDPDNRLPHEGYLYFFLDTSKYPNEDFDMLVEYSKTEPECLITDYNDNSCMGDGLSTAYLITFEKAEADYPGTKLLGIPSNYVDEYNDKPELLLQYDPYDFDVPYLATLDGYAFVFFGRTKRTKFSDLLYIVEGS